MEVDAGLEAGRCACDVDCADPLRAGGWQEAEGERGRVEQIRLPDGGQLQHPGAVASNLHVEPGEARPGLLSAAQYRARAPGQAVAEGGHRRVVGHLGARGVSEKECLGRAGGA